MEDSGSAGKHVLNLDGEVKQDTRDAARSYPVGRYLGSGSIRASDNDVVSSGRTVRNHMRVSVGALNGHFTRSGEGQVDILLHLYQRLEMLADMQLWSIFAWSFLSTS